jgi:hypothetical protein
MGIRGGLGGFLLKKTAAKSIRQRHHTGPMYNRRKVFSFPKGTHQLHKRISGRQAGSPTQQPEHALFSYLPGDVQRRPEFDFTFQHDARLDDGEETGRRVDKLRYAWQPRGRLQVHQLGGKAETFVCYRCGYPTRSNLQVIRDDNWDWRMCYKCYLQVVRNGQESDV